MTAYKAPTFADRQAAAAAARDKALAKLKAKPPLDPELVAERKAAAERKQAAAEEKRLARIVEREAAKVEAAAAAEAAKALIKQPMTEAEKKAERDARYAARKARKK